MTVSDKNNPDPIDPKSNNQKHAAYVIQANLLLFATGVLRASRIGKQALLFIPT